MPAPARPEPNVLRVRGPGDILGVVPYLLGFHPEDSLVAVFLRDRQVRVTARIDLAAVAEPDHLVEQLELVGLRVGTRSVILIGYGSDEGIADLMRGLTDLVPLDLVDVLAVGAGRWWSVACDGGCCPVEGRSYDIGAHPLAAEAVLAGISATATRDEIAALTAGPAPSQRERLDRLAVQCAERLAGMGRRRRRQRMKRLIGGLLAAGVASESEAVEVAVLAADVVVRDAAWAMMSRERAEEHLALWQRVVAVAVAPYEAAPLGLLAVAGWLSGNGALLNCAIDRLELVAPDYSLLELCRGLSDQAIPPEQFDALAAQLLSDLG